MRTKTWAKDRAKAKYFWIIEWTNGLAGQYFPT